MHLVIGRHREGQCTRTGKSRQHRHLQESPVRSALASNRSSSAYVQTASDVHLRRASPHKANGEEFIDDKRHATVFRYV